MTSSPFRVKSHSEAETFELGKRLGQYLMPGNCIALQGELGSGKTVLVKGLMRGMGCDDPVTSPSFVIAQQYRGRFPIWHVDLYRLSEDDNPAEIGLEEMLSASGVVLIEWADRWRGELSEASWIEFERVSDMERQITFRGAWGDDIVQGLRQ